MLRNPDPTTALALVLTLALLPSVAVALPLFSVSAGPSASAGQCTGATINFISGSTTPAGVSHVCSDAIGATFAHAFAIHGSAGASAEAVTFGTFQPRIVHAAGTFRDQVVFSKTDPSLPDQFPVSLMLALNGRLNASSTAGGVGSAGLEIDVHFLEGWMFDARFSTGDGLTFSVLNNFNPSGSFFPGVGGFNALLTTPSRLASIGSTEYAVTIHTFAGSSGPFGSAISDFSHTLAFPSGVDVFNLPAGYTVNAGNYLVNNRFITNSVPEPETYLLLLTGLGLLGVRVRRRNRILQ